MSPVTPQASVPIRTDLPEDLLAIFNGNLDAGITKEPVVALLAGIHRQLVALNAKLNVPPAVPAASAAPADAAAPALHAS